MSTTENPILAAQATIKDLAGIASIGRATAQEHMRLTAAKRTLADNGWDTAEIRRLQNRCVMAFRHAQVRGL